MKCRNGCWYCRDLCEICLQQAILGPATLRVSDRTLKFCSELCHKIYSATPEPQSLVFTPEDQHPSNKVKVPEGHKEFLRLYSNGKLDDLCFMTSVSLCEGDGSESFPVGDSYINYHIRTLNYQCHYEYFISQDLHPLSPVTYSKVSVNLFDEEDCEDIIQSSMDILRGAFLRSGLSSIPEFFEMMEIQKIAMATPNSLFFGTANNVAPSDTALFPPEKDESANFSSEELNSERMKKIQQFMEDFVRSGGLADLLEAFDLNPQEQQQGTGEEIPMITEIDNEKSNEDI